MRANARPLLPVVAVVALASFTACGGGGGSSPPPPPPADSEPDAFMLAPVANAARGTAVESVAVTIGGINVPAGIAVTTGEYSIDGGTFTSAAGTVTNGQRIVVRVTSSTAPGGSVEARLTVGSVGSTFNVMTSTDVTPPTATVVFPTERSRTSVASIIVRGTAADSESQLRSVRVNDVEATSADGFATWTAEVPLAPGENSLVVDAEDRALNRSPATMRAAVTRNALFGYVEGVLLDATTGRVFAADTSASVLLSIDLATGHRTILSGNSPSTTSERFYSPGAVAVDASPTHVLVLDRGNAPSIMRVEVATGARTVVSGRGVPNHDNEFQVPRSMSVDAQTGFAYVLSVFPPAIHRVHLGTGARTVLSDATTPNGNNFFASAYCLALDAARNRLLVGSAASDVLYAVDLATGARSVLSSNTVPNGVNPLTSAGGLGVDAPRNRALVLQLNTRSIIAVDLTTGARTVFSSDAVPNAANPFRDPRAITLDEAGGRALVADAGSRSLLAVDLATGERTVLSPNEPGDVGAPLHNSSGLALDLAGRRLFVSDPTSAAVAAIDLATAQRTVVANNASPGPAWQVPYAVAFDAAQDRLLVPDFNFAALYTVALATGTRAVLSNSAIPNGNNAFIEPSTVAIDATRNRALVVDNGPDAIIAVDLATGARTTLSGPGVPNGASAFIPDGIVVDGAANRALVTELVPPSVIAVDLDTGARSVFASTDAPGMWTPRGIGIDPATRLIVTGDFGSRSVNMLDPTSGARTLASADTRPRATDSLKPRGIAVDAARRIAWVTHDEFGIPQMVDLVTGERVFLTR